MKTRLKTHSRCARDDGLQSRRTSAARAVRIGRILVAVDFSKESQKAIQYALSFGRHFGAAITFLHVVEPIRIPADFGYGPVTKEITDKEKLRTGVAKMRALGRKIAETALDLPVDTLVLSGTPFCEIINAAKSRKADLMIVGIQGCTGTERSKIGGTTQRLIAETPCPVLILHRQTLG